MSWNYRVMRHEWGDESYYAIHEVHYDDAGNVTGWAEGEARVMSGGHDELTRVLDRMREALAKDALDARTGLPITETVR